MQCKVESASPVTDPAAKKETGKTLKQWFEVLDAQGDYGRRKAVQYLYATEKVPEWWAVTIAVEYERARGMLKKDGLLEGYGICVTKTIKAEAADVYRAWTDTKALAQWFGDGVKAQVEDGGSFKDGAGNRGSFQRVRENKDLRFSWENPAFSTPSLVDVTFDGKTPGKTLLMVNHSRIQTRAEADGLRSAWGEALDRLKQQLEG